MSTLVSMSMSLSTSSSLPSVFSHHQRSHFRFSVLGHALTRFREFPGSDDGRPERQQRHEADDDGRAAAVRQCRGEVGPVVRVLDLRDVVLDEQNGDPVAGLEISDPNNVQLPSAFSFQLSAFSFQLSI